MLYVEKIENHKIGANTPFPKVAKSLGWTMTIDESNTEKAYDGTLWEKGCAPQKPVELMQAEVRAVRNNLLNETDKFMILDYPIEAEESELYKDYRKYLRDYTLMENWWLENPKTFDEWKKENVEKIQVENDDLSVEPETGADEVEDFIDNLEELSDNELLNI